MLEQMLPAKNPVTASAIQKPLKAIFFLGAPNPFVGAGWTRISFFAEFFKKRGHGVGIMGLFSPKSLNKAGSKIWNGIRILNMCPTFWRETILSTFFNILSSILTLALSFLILKPDVVVISVPSGEPSIGAYLASRIAGCKIIFDYRDEWEDFAITQSGSKTRGRVNRLLKVLMNGIYARSDQVVSVTKPLAKKLALRGVRGVKVIPNGADTRVFRPYARSAVRREIGLSQDDFVVVYSGIIGAYYRLDIVVRALKKVSKRIPTRVKLLIVGEGPDLRRIMALAECLGLQNDVHYLGLIGDMKKLARILAASDVGIIPVALSHTLSKGALPVKFFEYCACGVPVVAMISKDSILAKLIKENKVGVIVGSEDEGKLAEAIRSIYKNKLFARVARKNARRLVMKEFDRDKISDSLLELTQRIVSHKPKNDSVNSLVQ